MTKTELYYKLVTCQIVGQMIVQHRISLQQDLYAKASDPVVFKRRMRMLSQLALYESQIYQKIYNFCTDDVNDYALTMQWIMQELYHVTDRNG